MFNNGKDFTVKADVEISADAKMASEQLRLLKKQANELSVSFQKMAETFNSVGKTKSADIATQQLNQLNQTLVAVVNTLMQSSYKYEDLTKHLDSLAQTLSSTSAAYSSLRKEALSLDLPRQEKDILKLQDGFDKLKFSIEKAIDQKKRWTSTKNVEKAQKELKALQEEENKVNLLAESFKRLERERKHALASGDISKVKELNKEINKQAEDIDKYTLALRKHKQQVRDTVAAMNEMHRGKWVVEVSKRALAYASVYASIYGLVASGKQAIQVLSMLDTQLQTMEAVLGVSSVKAQNLQNVLIQMSETFGVSVEQIHQVAIEFGRAGVAIDNIAMATKVAASMAILTGDSLNVASGALITFMTNYDGLLSKMYKGQNAIDILGNKLMYVANASKLSTQDIATLSNYAVASARSMGLTVDALGALAIAMSNAGNNASTIGTNIRRLQKIIFGTTDASMHLFQQLGMSQQWLISQLRKGLDGTVEGAKASNDALKTFITNLMNLSDEQFNKLTADMNVLTKQTLTQIRNTGQATKDQIDKLMGITKGQLNSALVIANSFANSWVRIKNKVVEFVNYAKPALQGVMDVLNNVVSALSSGQEQKLSDISNQILDINDRMKMLKELGLGDSPMFKNLQKQAKALKKEIISLKKELGTIQNSEEFAETLKTLFSSYQARTGIMRIGDQAQLSANPNDKNLIPLNEKIMNGQTLSLEEAKEYVKIFKRVENSLDWKYDKEQLIAVNAYLEAIKKHYGLIEDKNGKIVKTTTQEKKNLKNTLDKVSILNADVLSYYKKLGSIELQLGDNNKALQVTKDLFTQLKIEATHFYNSIATMYQTEYPNSKSLKEFLALLGKAKNANNKTDFTNNVYNAQAIFTKAQINHEAWAQDKSKLSFLHDLISGTKTYIDLTTQLNNTEEKETRNSTNNYKQKYKEFMKAYNSYIQQQGKAFEAELAHNKKVQALLQQLQKQYNNLYLTPKQQLNAWYNDMLSKILAIKDNLERLKGLKALNGIYTKKEDKIEQNKLGFDDKTYKAYKDLSKKFGENSAKSFENSLSIFMKSANWNDLFSNIGKNMAKNGGTNGALVGFFVQHLQETMTYIFDKVYKHIRNRYTGKIEAYNQISRNETLRAQAYSAFGFEGKGAVASYQADLANTKALEGTYKMDYALMKRAKINKEATQYTMEAASIVAGTAAAVYFDGGAVLQGLNMALDAKNWADKATGFSKFQQQFIQATEQYKEAIRKLADDLIKISGDIYKSIKDYRSIFDKITNSKTYKVQNYKESLSFISKYSDLTTSSLANLTQNVLKASKGFVEGATKTAGDVKKLMQNNIFNKYGLAIDALNSKFKNSLGVIANLIDMQRKAKDAIADYVAQLKGSLGDTTYNKRYTQGAFAQALKDYYAGKVNGSTLLEKAKAYQAAGGDVSKIIKTLQGVEAQSTKDYLKGILNAVTQFNAIGLPSANIKELKSPEVQTLSVIKDTKNILERIIDLLGNIKFKNLLSGILDGIKKIVKILKGIFGIGSNMIVATTKAAVTIVKGIAHAITVAFKGLGHLLNGAWDWTKHSISSVYSWTKHSISSVYSWTKHSISSVYSWGGKEFSKIWKIIKHLGGILGGGIKSVTGSVKNTSISLVTGTVGLSTSAAVSVAHGVGHIVKHLFAQGGYTGNGVGQRDSTGEIVAGIVHAGEWVAPKWMVNSMPSMFNALESLRVGHSANNSLFNPVVNVAVDLGLIRETNAILVQQASIQKKMLRLMQKFDEEGIKCVS